MDDDGPEMGVAHPAEEMKVILVEATGEEIQTTISNKRCRWRNTDGSLCGVECNTLDDALTHIRLCHVPSIRRAIEQELTTARAARARVWGGYKPGNLTGRVRPVMSRDIAVATYACRWQQGEDNSTLCLDPVQERCFVKHLGNENHFGFVFLCQTCGKGYARLDSLSRHRKSCK